MYKIAIAIQKGGTGKTITSVCLGGALALMKKRVLLIDMDPQANTTRIMALDPTNLEPPTASEVLLDAKISAASAIVQTAYGIDIIPSNVGMALTEKQLVGVGSYTKLSKKLRELESFAENNPDFSYDYIIIDCPPSLGTLTINSLAAVDWVIAPVNSAHEAEQGLSDFFATMQEVQAELNPKMEFMGVLLTQYSGIKTNKDVSSYLRETMPDKIFKTVISRRAVLTEVAVKGPIQAFAPTSESTLEYKAFAQEVEKHVKK